jgi:hypothetical protein
MTMSSISEFSAILIYVGSSDSAEKVCFAVQPRDKSGESKQGE